MTTANTCLGRNDGWSLGTDDCLNGNVELRRERLCLMIVSVFAVLKLEIFQHKEIIVRNKYLFNYFEPYDLTHLLLIILSCHGSG